MTTSPSDVVAPATVRDLTTPDGRTLRTYEAGDPGGLLVVVHHGTPCSGVLAPWWAQDAAEKGIRLVGFDRPGYAGSTRRPGRAVADVAADVVTIADALGADRFATWGVSGGGPHALACAALLPDRVVAAATLASVAPYGAPGLDWFAGMGQDNLDEFGAALQGEQPLRDYLAPASASLVAAPPGALAEEMRSLLPPVDLAALTGPVGDFSQEWLVGGQRGGYEGWLDDDLAFARDWGFDLADIAVPVLLLQGRHDLMVPFAHGEWLAGRIPTAQPRLTDDDGHMTLIADLGPVHGWLVTQPA